MSGHFTFINTHMSFTIAYHLVIMVTYIWFSFGWILYIFLISSPLFLHAAIEFHLTDRQLQ